MCTPVPVLINSIKSDGLNRNIGSLRLEGSELFAVEMLEKHVAVDHKNCEDAKGNLSPLFTSEHNVSIVGAALKPGCRGS